MNIIKTAAMFDFMDIKYDWLGYKKYREIYHLQVRVSKYNSVGNREFLTEGKLKIEMKMFKLFQNIRMFWSSSLRLLSLTQILYIKHL